MPIVTECALKRAARIGERFRSAIDHAEWTGDDAIAAPVTNIILYENRTDFRSHDGAGWTRLEATGFLAVLANIREKNPAKWLFRIRRGSGGHVAAAERTDNLLPFSSILLEKQNVTPR